MIVPSARLDGVERAGRHYLATLTAQPGEPVVSYVGAGWTASGDVDSIEDWWAVLDGEAARLATPVVVTVGE